MMLKQRSPGQPLKVVSVVVMGDRDERTVLKLAASLAHVVDEALSTAILENAADDMLAPGHVSHVYSIPGKGVAGSINGHAAVLGNSSFLSDVGIYPGDFGRWIERFAPLDDRVLFVAVDGQLAGFLRVSMHHGKEGL